MNYKSFEDLPVWQAAIEFVIRVFEFTAKADFSRTGDLKGQLERAAVSISNNIAEGFERGTNAELIAFLYIDRGSAGECRSMLCLCERLRQFGNFRSDILNLQSRAKNISQQLFGWIESLKNSDIKGEKFFTEKEKFKRKEKEDWPAFKRELDEAQKQNIETSRRRFEQSKLEQE